MTTADIKIGILRAWPVFVTLVIAGGVAVAGIRQLDAVNLAQQELEKEHSTDIREIRDAVGAVQLDVADVKVDMALVCSELVRARGGNPLQECKTHGR